MANPSATATNTMASYPLQQQQPAQMQMPNMQMPNMQNPMMPWQAGYMPQANAYGNFANTA